MISVHATRYRALENKQLGWIIVDGVLVLVWWFRFGQAATSGMEASAIFLSPRQALACQRNHSMRVTMEEAMRSPDQIFLSITSVVRDGEQVRRKAQHSCLWRIRGPMTS